MYVALYVPTHLIPPKTIRHQNKTNWVTGIMDFQLSEPRNSPFSVMSIWNFSMFLKQLCSVWVRMHPQYHLTKGEDSRHWIYSQHCCDSLTWVAGFFVDLCSQWTNMWCDPLNYDTKKTITGMHEDHKLLHQSTNFITCYRSEYRSNKGIQLYSSQKFNVQKLACPINTEGPIKFLVPTQLRDFL